VQTWCGLTRLREVTERLRPRLLTLRNENGQELFDLPDAPRPDSDTPAPPRFLPEYDNVLLSHADRSRIYTGGYRPPPHAGKGGFIGNVLVDGFFRATFTITRQADGATLLITPFDRLSRKDATALSEEGERLLHFVTEPEGARTLEIRYAEHPLEALRNVMAKGMRNATMLRPDGVDGNVYSPSASRLSVGR
jgi:hypothetical protein